MHVLSYQVTEAKYEGSLQTVLERFEQPVMPASLVYRSQLHMPRKTRALIGFPKPKLRKRLAEDSDAQASALS